MCIQWYFSSFLSPLFWIRKYFHFRRYHKIANYFTCALLLVQNIHNINRIILINVPIHSWINLEINNIT